MKSTCWFLLGADNFGLVAKPLKKKEKVESIRFYSGPKWLGSCWVVFSLPISEIVPLTYLLGGTTHMQAHLHPAVPSTDYSLLFLLLLKGPKRNLGFDHKQIILTWLLLLV